MPTLKVKAKGSLKRLLRNANSKKGNSGGKVVPLKDVAADERRFVEQLVGKRTIAKRDPAAIERMVGKATIANDRAVAASKRKKK